MVSCFLFPATTTVTQLRAFAVALTVVPHTNKKVCDESQTKNGGGGVGRLAYPIEAVICGNLISANAATPKKITATETRVGGVSQRCERSSRGGRLRTGNLFTRSTISCPDSNTVTRLCRSTHICPTYKQKSLRRIADQKWRWRGSNPRPNKEPQSFLHV